MPGLKKRVTNPNNTNSTYEYDAADRMTDIVHMGPVGVVSSYFYAYDQNGNRKRQIETNAGRTEETTYDYDAANRLTMVTYALATADATQVTYTYDAVGNRLSEREIQLPTSTATKDLAYVYDAINRLDTITDNLGGGEETEMCRDRLLRHIPRSYPTWETVLSRGRRENTGCIFWRSPRIPSCSRAFGWAACPLRSRRI